jgi:transcriptional regulator
MTLYNPAPFALTDRERALDLVERVSFGTLVCAADGGEAELAHLPFVVDRARGLLLAHVARGNGVWRRAERGELMSAVFLGPHAYVSPLWYEHPDAQVPTWNYAAVHVHGHARGPMDDTSLREMLHAMSRRFEAPDGWSLDRLTPELSSSLARGIVGFALSIERVDAKLKLSQNRSPADHARVERALATRGDDAGREMAEMMRSPTGR